MVGDLMSDCACELMSLLLLACVTFRASGRFAAPALDALHFDVDVDAVSDHTPPASTPGSIAGRSLRFERRLATRPVPRLAPGPWPAAYSTPRTARVTSRMVNLR